MMLFRNFNRLAATASLLAGLVASGTAYAETTLVVGYQQIVGPFVAAIADGSFDAAAKEVGYTIDWRQFSSAGDITTALASGDVPIGVLGSTGTASAATRGVELQLFWILDNIGKSEALVARDGSGIETPANLKGKKVAVPFVSTSHFHLLVGMSKVWNVDPREVEILNLKPPQIVAAWQRGDIDAAYVWPPALSEILKTGKTISDSEVIGAASVPTFDGLVVDKAWAEENPKLMEAFTKVLAQSYADYNADKAAWTVDSPQVQGIVKLIGGDGPSTVEALDLLSFPNADEQASDTWLGGGATRALSESAKFLVEQKQIGKSLDDYAPYVNSSFAAAAAK
ncbi:MAG TPA: taurine ABC transporter substrate-binding protein [Shinella sp.]|jgi:taurine transport system substrate-binding protein|uniref:taurine ABC transporter substrate-binding protein n=1 Tax=Shinella sp. TaxID=1870904 RepID=UPI002E0E080B|nr:taurine ABC transporter substrate-binding protein [Shinella sp.]